MSALAGAAGGARGGKDYRFYFIGNSLSRGLSLASGQDRARLEGLFRLQGRRMIFGTQLGAGVNLDEHVTKTRLTVSPPQPALSLTHMDDWGETGTADGSFGHAFFRDYRFAFQGNQRDASGVITTGNTFDAIILQPYQSLLEHAQYTADERAKAQRGDRSAISNLIAYAIGNSPSNQHRVARQFYIYTAWPRLEGIEGRALDGDGDGVYSFGEFYSAPFSAPGNPAVATDAAERVPSRDYAGQLFSAVAADHPSETIRLIPVGEVFALLDGLIRGNNLPGVSNYFSRNARYYLDARLDGNASLGAAGFIYIYPPGQPAAYASDFVAAQGVKNFYCDRIHMNDQTHNDDQSGTIGAYVAAATMYTVMTGEKPDVFSAEDVASLYEKFDAVDDRDLIAALQEAIWNVVTSANWYGIDYSARTGVSALPSQATSYEGFRASCFSAADRTNALISGEAADPDSDGLANVAEFYRQTNPTNCDSAASVSIRANGAGFHAAFSGLTHAPGLIPMLEMACDLDAAWLGTPLRSLARTAGANGLTDYWCEDAGAATRRFHRYALSFVPDAPTRPLVAWGPGSNAVTSSPSLLAGSGSTSIDLTVPANPAIGPSYSNASPQFFAAASAFSGNSVGAYRIGDGPAGSSDTIHVNFARGAAAENHGVFAAVWTKAGNGSAYGFLDGARTGSVTLAGMRARAKVNSATTGVSQTRFIIRIASRWYISDDRGAVTAATFFEDIALANPAAATWYSFDPADILAVGAPVTIRAFDNITAVGINWRSYVTGSTATLQIESFRAECYDQ